MSEPLTDADIAADLALIDYARRFRCSVPMHLDDAAFVAGAVQHWPLALAEVPRLRAENAALRERLAMFEAAEEIQVRRGWWAEPIGRTGAWTVKPDSVPVRVADHTPTTAIIIADRWAKEHGI